MPSYFLGCIPLLVEAKAMNQGSNRVVIEDTSITKLLIALLSNPLTQPVHLTPIIAVKRL